MRFAVNTNIHPVLAEVTARITERSRPERTAYLERLDAAAERGPARGRLACANLAHGFAASGPVDKSALRGTVKPNVAIVSAYNDMLSAHQPFESFPAQLKKAVIRSGGIAQFAGGVPAMCDGITQGRDGMQLSLFSRDVIAMFGLIVPRSAFLSVLPEAANPCARFAQASRPRAGPRSPASRIWCRYAARGALLRSVMRSVTACRVGWMVFTVLLLRARYGRRVQ